MVLLKGILVEVDKNKTLDPIIEDLFRYSHVIKYYKGKISFYIPHNLTIIIYNRICSGKTSFSIEKIPIEETLIYLGEENGYTQS